MKIIVNEILIININNQFGKETSISKKQQIHFFTERFVVSNLRL